LYFSWSDIFKEEGTKNINSTQTLKIKIIKEIRRRSFDDTGT